MEKAANLQRLNLNIRLKLCRPFVLYDRRISVRLDKATDGPLELPEGLKGVGMGLGANGAPLTDVARNLPSLNLSNVQPAPNLTATSTSTLAALAGTLSQQLDSRLLDTAFARRQLDLVGGLGKSLTSTLSAADLGLSSAAVLNSFSSALNSTGASSGGGYLSGGLSGRDFDSLSAVISNSVSKFDYGGGSGGGGLDRVSSIRGLRSLNRLSDMVIITNLLPNTTWQILRDQFGEVSDIKFAEIKGKDVEMIRFSNENEASRAVAFFDRIRFDGRTIDFQLF